MGQNISIVASDIQNSLMDYCSSHEAIQKAASQPWIVDRFVAADSIGWFYGAPGSFKSFLLMDMAMHVSTGTPWMGRDVDPGPVLWLAGEGGADLHFRRRAWEAKHQKDAPIIIRHVDVNLLDDNGHKYIFDRVVEYMDAILEPIFRNRLAEYLESNNPHEARKICSWLDVDFEEARKLGADTPRREPRWTGDRYIGGGPLELYRRADREIVSQLMPRMIVVDTFAQTSGNDSTGPAVSEYIRRLKRCLKTISGRGGHCAILVIDHTTKGGDSYMGALAKEGDSDLMAKIERQSDLLSVIKTKAPHGKLKFAEAPDDIHVELQPHPVTDAEGQPVTDTLGRVIESLVCTDGSKKARLAEIAKADANSAQTLLLELLQAYDGEPAPDSEIRAQFLELPAMQEKKPATARQAYLRAKKALSEDGLISIDDDHISLI